MSSRSSSPSASLVGRRKEREVLDGLVRAATSGSSAVLVVQGDPGIGKSALLDYVEDATSGCQVLRLAGVESQIELVFAGLHQLCRPLLGMLDRLPGPQADALGTALGLRAGNPPDRFLVGLAALSLLAEGAQSRPLVCLVDDAQWLDRASAQTLTFVARRLRAESICLVVALRAGVDDETWAGLPYLMLRGLPKEDATTLLQSAMLRPLDARVRDRILAEAHGNPLALLELPRWFSATELTFGPYQGRGRTTTNRMEEVYRRQLEPLPEPSRQLLLIAAAEPVGDVALLWRAAQRLGIPPDAVVPAQAAGLIELRETVRFRHPLVRSVAYRSAPTAQRQAAHRALADALDPDRDPDRHAWHRAHAATGPDEEVAAELERSAERARAHGGLVAAAAFLEHSAMLSPDATVRAERQIEAAQAMLHAGTFDAATSLLSITVHEPLTPLQQARVEVLDAQIAFASNRGSEALPLLLAAARRLEPLNVELALDTYVDALTAALFAGRLAPGGGAVEVAQAARCAPMPAHPRRGDILLQAIAILFADGYPAAVPLLRRAVQVFDTDEVSLAEGVRFMWLAAVTATDLWDERGWDSLTSRHLKIVRESGALSALPLALNTRVFVELFAGNLAGARTLLEGINAVNDAAEISTTPYAAIGLAAFEGHEGRATPLIAAAQHDAAARGEGIGVSLTHWAQALLCNGLGRYRDAVRDGSEATAHPEEVAVGTWGLVELIEAAVRAGQPTRAAATFEQLSEMTRASGTDWALGVAARSEAQLLDGLPAETLYREAIERLKSTAVRSELARAHLLYGEWLRRAGRRLDAREQLRTALDSLMSMGMAAFAERARRELAATGETVRKRTDDTRHTLTAQELHIARLAADGLTNPEIGAELFISPRTVEWHMRKMFAKMGITARRQLRDALRSTAPDR